VSEPTQSEVRAFVEGFVSRKLKEFGKTPLHDLRDDYDLMQSGALDSLSFVEMLTLAGQHFAGQISLEDLDPEKMTVVGPLCTFVSEQLRACSARQVQG
jgi:acyl carrier protein